MDEYMDKEAFKKNIDERYCKPCKAEGKDHNGCWCRACWVDDMLDEVDCFQPSDVSPVVHGRWILEREPNGKPYCFHCSVCDSDYHCIGVVVASDYCPNCGAKMEVDHEDD